MEDATPLDDRGERDLAVSPWQPLRPWGEQAEGEAVACAARWRRTTTTTRTAVARRRWRRPSIQLRRHRPRLRLPTRTTTKMAAVLPLPVPRWTQRRGVAAEWVGRQRVRERPRSSSRRLSRLQPSSFLRSPPASSSSLPSSAATFGRLQKTRRRQRLWASDRLHPRCALPLVPLAEARGSTALPPRLTRPLAPPRRSPPATPRR